MLEDTASPRRGAIIGAGASGLTAAKQLIEAGIEVTIYEKGSQIGGLWVYENDNGSAIAYKSLHINTEKGVTEFSDFPFGEGVQTFPSHDDMAEYLRSYADEFDVTPRIRFRSPVENVEPRVCEDPHRIQWTVRSGGSEESFDFVVIASGHMSVPLMPQIVANFSGDVSHAAAYREPMPFANKRVLVVGSGNSGCDIAADICTVAERTVMVARSPELVTPKILFGRPLTQVVGIFDKWWLPPGVPNMIKRLATLVVHGRMERWGFETPRGRTHPTSNPTIIGHIAYGRIEVKRGIEEIEGSKVRFVDGLAEEFDAIICATGYDTTLPMISSDIVPVGDKTFPMYLFCASPTWPGLYFVGFSNASASSNLRMFELQSSLITMYETGQGVMPDMPDIEKERLEREAYIQSNYPPGPKYTLELEPAHFQRLVRRERKEAPRRLGRVARSKREAVLANRSLADRLSAVGPLQGVGSR